MIAPRGVVVCVGYDDLLSISLPLNLRHLAECLVVTSPDDERTRLVASRYPGVVVHETAVFTADGARFNKGRAINEGIAAFGRHGWMLIWDADTIFPDRLDLGPARVGRLHGARRLVLDDAKSYDGPAAWRRARLQKDDPAIGFFQLFHADDPAIRDKKTWYHPKFGHAGGCDDYFVQHWPRRRRVTLPIACLHLGPVATNWYGRASARVDGLENPDAEANARAMDALIRRFDWHWARPGLRMGQLADDPSVPHRIEVAGEAAGDAREEYEVPFAARARVATGRRRGMGPRR